MGNLWHLVHRDLTREETLRLLADPSVRVGVHAQRALVRWVRDDDKQRVWREEVEPHFHDRVRGEALTTGQLPFHATRWRRRGSEVLVFDDFD